MLEAARDDAEDLGDPDLLARVYALLLRIRTMIDENYADREYRAVMDRAYALALQVRTAELRAFLQGMMGQVLRSAERYSAAVELAGGSVGLLEDAGRFGEAGFNAAITADVEASQGHFDEAARWIARGAALAEASGNPNVIADVELMKGRIAAARGELETALTHTRLGMETAEGAGNIQHTLVGNFLVADQQLRRGDAAAAIPHLERTFELGAYRNAEAIVGLGNAWLASARAHLGDLDPNVFSGPLEQAQAGRSRSGEAAVRLQRAIALAGSPEPDWDQAFDDFERAIALFASIDARPDQARAVHAYANAPDAAGRNEESRSQLETAMTMFDEMGIRPAAVPASEQPLVSETRATSIPIVEPTGPTRRPTPFRSIEPAFAAAGRLTDGNRSRCSHLAARLRWSCIHAVAPWSHEARHSTRGRCVMTTEELVRPESCEKEVPPERRETVSVHRPRFWWGVAAGAAVIAVVVGMALAVWLIGDEEVAQQVPIDSERELMQGLVNEGYLPAQALEPAPRDERALLEDLVNGGFVPAQALESSAGDETAVLEDLVNRGLVPAQALEPAAATSIYSAEEQALIDAVRKGFVPEQAIEEMMIIKRLTNQGLIPAGTGSG